MVVLDALGFGINTLTLGGLAIALGEVVDDAIIDVENIARRLRQNRLAAAPRSAAAVVLEASLEVRGSVVYATFVVALVFLPVLTLTGVQGALFRPLGLAYILAILASLVVALTVTPALTLLLLGTPRTPARTSRPRSPGSSALRERARVAGSIAPVRWRRRRRSSAWRRGHAAVLRAPRSFRSSARDTTWFTCRPFPGTSLDESVRLGARVTAALRAGSHGCAPSPSGSAGPSCPRIPGERTTPSSRSTSCRSRGRAPRRCRTISDGSSPRFPGVNFAIRGFLAERIEETLTGSTAEVVVRVFGDDLDSLDVAARRKVAETLARSPRRHRRAVRSAAGRARTSRCGCASTSFALYGLRPDDVLATVETATRGTRVAQTFDGNRATDVVVTLAPERRARPEDLGGCRSRPTSGRQVELGQIADIARTTGRFVDRALGARRVQTVTANVSGRDPEGVTRDLERRWAGRPRCPRTCTPRSAAPARRSGPRGASCCATACSPARAS